MVKPICLQEWLTRKDMKVVNIDHTNAVFFVHQGNPRVYLTFAVELSLFETQVLVKTPKGIRTQLVRHNVYNILGGRWSSS